MWFVVDGEDPDTVLDSSPTTPRLESLFDGRWGGLDELRVGD